MSFDIEHQVVPRDEMGAPDSSPGQRSDEAPVSSPGHRSNKGSNSSRFWIRSCCCSPVFKIVVGVGYLLYYVGYLLGATVFGALLFAVVFGALPALVIALVAIVVAVLAAALVIVVAVVLGLPILIPLGLIVVFSLPKKAAMRLTRDDSPSKEEELAEGIAGAYDRARWKEPMWDRIMIGSLGWTARVSLGVLIWLGLSLLVPRLRAVTLLGSPMWKWSLLGVTLTAGYFQALTFILPVLLWPSSGTTSYYLDALLLSISNVAYMGLVLGTWLAYFRTHHGLNHHHHHHRAFTYVTWSIVSFFVGSILMLFKNLLLLKWGADAIYRRFGPRVLITSLKYYFIGLLVVGFDETVILDYLNVVDQYGDLDDTPQTNPKRLITISKYVMSRKMNLSHLGYLNRILISLAQAMSPLVDGQGDNEEVVTWFKQKIKNNTHNKCTPAGLLKLYSSTDVAMEPSELPTSSSPTGEAEPPDQLAKEEVELPANVKLSFMEGARNRYITGTWNTFYLAIKNIFTPGAWKIFMSKKKPDKEDEEIQQKNKKLLNVLWRLVGEECSSHAFTFDDLKIWMVSWKGRFHS